MRERYSEGKMAGGGGGGCSRDVKQKNKKRKEKNHADILVKSNDTEGEDRRDERY